MSNKKQHQGKKRWVLTRNTLRLFNPLHMFALIIESKRILSDIKKTSRRIVDLSEEERASLAKSRRISGAGFLFSGTLILIFGVYSADYAVVGIQALIVCPLVFVLMFACFLMRLWDADMIESGNRYSFWRFLVGRPSQKQD